jgi:hypothetical protein
MTDNPDPPAPDTRHPVLTLLARGICRIIGVPLYLLGLLTLARVPFDRGMPARIIVAATMAGAGMLVVGWGIIHFGPKKGPPIRFGHQR